MNNSDDNELPIMSADSHVKSLIWVRICTIEDTRIVVSLIFDLYICPDTHMTCPLFCRNNNNNNNESYSRKQQVVFLYYFQ